MGSGLWWWNGGQPQPYLSDGNRSTIPVGTVEIHLRGVYSFSATGGSGLGSLDFDALCRLVGTTNAAAVELARIKVDAGQMEVYQSGHYQSGELLYVGFNLAECWCDPIQARVYPCEHVFLYRPNISGGWSAFWRDDSGGARWDILQRVDGTPMIPQADWDAPVGGLNLNGAIYGWFTS